MGCACTTGKNLNCFLKKVRCDFLKDTFIPKILDAERKNCAGGTGSHVSESTRGPNHLAHWLAQVRSYKPYPEHFGSLVGLGKITQAISRTFWLIGWLR